MDIKAELEKLLDECSLCADDLEDIISRLPPEAVVVPREPTSKMSWAAIKCHYDGHTTVEAMFRAMLQSTEENSDE